MKKLLLLLPFLFNLCFADTLTVYPDAGTEGDTGDASIGRFIIAGESWSSIRDGAGTNVSDTGSRIASIRSDSGGDWDFIYRGAFTFDTSSLSDSASITSATAFFYGAGKQDGVSITPTVNIYGFTGSAVNFQTSDYSNFGTTEFSSDISYASFSTSGYNEFSLNSSGIANISKTGISKFGTRESTYDAPNSEPTATNDNQESGFTVSFADTAGTTSDPKLVVEYSLPSAGNALFFGSGF
jgi:hypothetical protein